MSAYRFRPVTEADFTLLRSWRARPHVVEWWGSPDDEDPEEVLAEPRVAMWIVEHEGRPFAYAQDYDPHGWTQHPLAHLPHGSSGIDQYIGEPDLLGCGHGRAFVSAHCEQLFSAGVPRLARILTPITGAPFGLMGLPGSRL